MLMPADHSRKGLLLWFFVALFVRPCYDYLFLSCVTIIR